MLSATPLQALLGLSDTVGHILLTGAQNKSTKSTDDHRCSSKPWWLQAETLSVGPGKELGRASLATQDAHFLHNSCCKTQNTIFPFHKSENSLQISVSENSF